MSIDSELVIREMIPGEEDEVRNLYKKNLGIIDRLIFLLGFSGILKYIEKKEGACLVGLYDNKIVGTICVQLFKIDGENHGLIDMVASDKNVRGKGIAKSIIDRCISWFEENDCENIYAMINRYNSRSWNMFLHKGFSLYEFSGQTRDLGIKFLKLWNAEFFWMGICTFFVKKDIGEEKPKEVNQIVHFIFAWLIYSLTWFIQMAQWGNSLTLFPTILIILIIVGLSIFLHEISHTIVAHFFGLKTSFKIWESGILFSLLLTLVNTIFPSYGSTYIEPKDWSYVEKEKKHVNGIIFAIGPIMSFSLAILCKILQPFAFNELWSTALNIGFILNIMFTLFNLLPIKGAGGFGWDGGKIYDWNKFIWLFLMVIFIVFWIFNPLN